MARSTASSSHASEVLACPHCDRLFQVTPAVLGKKIRCRDCRQIFHVPLDIASVPLGPAVAAGGTGDEPLPPVANASVQDGRDVRSCPACARTFAMKAAFVGKTIRCRGCKESFRVLATKSAPIEPRPAKQAPLEAAGLDSPPVSPVQPRPAQPPVAPPPVPAAIPTAPMIFEDIGDVLEDLLPGENVISVVRPRTLPRRSKPADMAPALVIAVALLGVCVVLASNLVEGERQRWRRADPANDVAVVSPPKAGGGRKSADSPSPLDNVDKTKPLRGTDKPKPAPLPPEATAALEGLLKDVLVSLRREDFAAADRSLADAAKRASSNREASVRVQRWRLFTDYARRFVGHRAQAFENANQGREYQLDGDVVAVSECGPEYITYRIGGKDERIPRSKLDPRVEMAIVGTWFAEGGNPENHIYLGVRWLCLNSPDQERARREWQTAQSRGAPVERLLPILDEPFIR